MSIILKNGVAFGCTMPGTDNNMHGDDEFAVVDELILVLKYLLKQ